MTPPQHIRSLPLRRRVLATASKSLALLAILAGSLVALAPASWFDQALQTVSQGVLMLGNPQGRIWQGRGDLQALLPNGRAATLAPVRWSISGTRLLAGELRFTLVSEQTGNLLLDATATHHGVQLHSVRLELPAPLLGAFTPTLREADLGGTLNLHSDGSQLQNNQLTGKFEIRWLNAASSITQVRPLGSYLITLTGQGDALKFSLATLNGELTLAGDGRWKMGQRLLFDGTASPSETRQQELAPLLRILGREIRPGVYQLELDPNVGAV